MTITSAEAFQPDASWDDMSPCEHFVHFYRSEDALLRLLQDFVVEGLRRGDATVVIGTPAHLAVLERGLVLEGLDVVAARWQGQYLRMDADATLAQFMVDGVPDEALFERVMGDVLNRARRNGRGVRAFGEMVALLWARGQSDATVRLEELWDAFCRRESLPLFCAYPRDGFTPGDDHAFGAICRAHSRLVAA